MTLSNQQSNSQSSNSSSEPNPELSILVPVYNEGATIAEILRRLLDLPLSARIIVIDNGSTDNTADQILAFEGDLRLVYLYYDEIQGKGAALRAGLTIARGEYVVVQDGDLEYDPADIVRMLKFAQENSLDAVFGSRILNPQAGVSYQRFYWGGRLLTWLANQLFDVGITDEATCYKMVRRRLLMSLNLECERFEFCPEVVAKLGLLGIEIRELPIYYKPRSIDEGKKIRWSDGVEAIWTLVKWALRGEKLVRSSATTSAPAPKKKTK
ncbi:glycosyltransferase family 2 protein [Gemmatimonas aurantiaca]|nr:glycosyltransferase family 2 protein [Gemmatimonas aurantiaca]